MQGRLQQQRQHGCRDTCALTHGACAVARGNRKIGLAKSQFDSIHANRHYDYIVDIIFRRTRLRQVRTGMGGTSAKPYCVLKDASAIFR